jgi:hypothetical protein
MSDQTTTKKLSVEELENIQQNCMKIVRYKAEELSRQIQTARTYGIETELFYTKGSQEADRLINVHFRNI